MSTHNATLLSKIDLPPSTSVEKFVGSLSKSLNNFKKFAIYLEIYSQMNVIYQEWDVLDYNAFINTASPAYIINISGMPGAEPIYPGNHIRIAPISISSTSFIYYYINRMPEPARHCIKIVGIQ